MTKKTKKQSATSRSGSESESIGKQRDAASEKSLAHRAKEAADVTNGQSPLVVGVGASAGGLEALESFLRNVPAKSGMAIVVVQHIGPEDRGMLAQLLSRVTSLPVAQIEDGVRAQSDHVYVTPARTAARLEGGHLFLTSLAESSARHLPIDLFFRSLAQAQGDRSIGVVLSGTGTDGTLGLQAIAEAAGTTFVQEPSSAKFDGMPRSAIESGKADIVADVAELPEKILGFRRSAAQLRDREKSRPDTHAKNTLAQILALLHSRTGNDFSQYKTSTIVRRIERRMGLHQTNTMPAYASYLREHPEEVLNLFKELLINVTCFFRDTEVWEALATEAMPRVLENNSGRKTLRAWVPGCSTGEEAYSLAMVFKEVMSRCPELEPQELQIFATDIDSQAIERARAGFFQKNISVDVSAERLKRFFLPENGGYRVNKEIREMIIFAPQNMIMDPPFTRLDFLTCRNVLIYLSAELQNRLLPLFSYSLDPHGVLLLGSSETTGAFSNLFIPINGKFRLYRRARAVPSYASNLDFSSTVARGSSHAPRGISVPSRASAGNMQGLVEQVIATQFSPVAILCSEQGEILYISRRAGDYLEPAVGKSNWNIFAMARDGLRFDL